MISLANSCVRKIEHWPRPMCSIFMTFQFKTRGGLKRQIERDREREREGSKERKLLKGVAFHNSLCRSFFGLISSVCLVLLSVSGYVGMRLIVVQDMDEYIRVCVSVCASLPFYNQLKAK